MKTKQRTLSAIAVTVAGYGGSQMIRLAGSLITTRILAPDLFGVMAIANAIAIMITLFSDLGFTLSIVRSDRGDQPSFLKTVFTFKVIQGASLWILILLITACLVGLQDANFFPPESPFSHEDLPIALIIISFASLLNGFKSIQLEAHVREQRLAKRTILELLSQTFALGFIIITALQSPTIYALAFANVVSATTAVVGSYLLYPNNLFGFAWDKESVHEIFSFGKWVTGSTAVMALSNNIDKFLFGVYLTASQMGVYYIASQLYQAMNNVINKAGSPLFATFSEILRKTPDDISAYYYKVRIWRDWLISLPTALVIANGDLIVDLVYDDRYLQAGFYLQLLSIGHLFECFLFKNQVITATGNSKIQFQMAAWRLAGLCILVPLGNYFYGVTGVILALSLRKVFGSWTLFKIFGNLGYLSWRKEALTIGVIACSLAIAYCTRLLVLYFLPAQ